MAKFQLADMLKDVSDLNTGREQIEYIPYSCLVPDANNGYSIARVEELARSIELVGLQQPPRVWPIAEAPGTYRIISGHRRYAAIGLLIEQGYKGFDQGVPCIVDSSKASAAFRELQLIMGNAENRDKTSADHLRDINGTADCLRRLEKEGYRFPGRHREWISKMIGLSESKIGRLQAIGKNLDPTLINYFNDGRLGESIAYRISQEAADVQAELSEKLGPAVQDLTLETVEKVIGQIKKPQPAETPPSPYRSSSDVFDVAAYLEERAKEDGDFFELLETVAKMFIDELGSVNTRQDGIELLKNEFGKAWRGGAGPGIAYHDSRPKGLTLQGRSTPKITRTWTEVYDMLCTIALNRFATGCTSDEDAEDVEDDMDDVEELPTVRWEGRSVTPPQRETLLLYQLTNAGPKYTPAVYCGGAVFRKPAAKGHQGAELTGIAQQFSQWLKFPDPCGYGDEYRVAPPAVLATDTVPDWQPGDPPRDGLYWCKFVVNSQVMTRAARWQEDAWHFANIEADIRCLCVGWWPLPEDEQT